MTTVEATGFFQDAPRLRDEWEDDLALQRYLERVLPADVRADITPALAEMGLLAATELKDLADAIDTREGEPRHVPFDAWGNRVDRVEPHPGWERMAEVAARHGVIATGYERAHGPWSRVHQFALAYLYGPSSALFSCPLAMTDGAAKTLLGSGDRELIDRAVPRLTSRDPDAFWTSGQWMTERTGGSDVGRSETVAVQDGGVWRLSGTKWFTSAITSQMALTLARPEGNDAGGRGLAMFYVEVRDEDGRLNNLRVVRLKDKLGTKQLPTAELALDGTVAHLVGPPSSGTRNIAPMLTITRLWNSIIAASGTRRGLALARDYARRREAFGGHLIDNPLHQTTLAWLRVQHEASLQLAFHAALLLGREEAGEASEQERLALRLLLPVTKLLTAKQAVAAASEAIESFGGAGYVEDTHLPVLLRDAQVLPIWEGTTNVLSMDALRAIGTEETVTAYAAEVRRAAETATDDALAGVGKLAVDAVDHASAWLVRALDGGPDIIAHGARRFAVTLGRALQAALLVAQGQHDLDVHGDRRAAAVARRFADEGIDVLDEPGRTAAADAALARDEAL
ncbi:acyl-CoA dehydrogenase family protein [Nitriliruptor alkaliphilus]|uniref:acyl-CoA dehydrogenase family protein n=1 Tax=Nitriliruptor alkaliphilus TaxID=427918 RepID=UPI000697F735|nr:acyl-CoA dehydrogenase family protein [Nitriliruptor alkaliphilus]